MPDISHSALFQIASDPDKIANHDTFASATTREGLSLTASQFDAFVMALDQQIFDQVERFSYLLYAHCRASGDWGDAGQQQLESAFARVVLQLAPEADLSYDEMQGFEQRVTQRLGELGLANLDAASIKQQFDDFQFKIFDKTYALFDIDDLDRCMRFAGSRRILQGGFYGHDREVILGEGRMATIGDFDVFFIDKELMRSPNAIVAMAAIIGEKQIYLRRESLITIFHMKWTPVAEDVRQWPLLYKGQPFRDISEGIKHKTMDLYGRPDPKALQNPFVADMQDTILKHEVGHGIIQHHLLDRTSATLGEASKVCGENILTGLLEVLADFAPWFEDVKGPMANMCDIAADDVVRAQRMFYMYFSDTWFFDTDDRYMYLYSDFLALIKTSLIHHDQSVNFRRLRDFLALGEECEDFSVVRYGLDAVVRITGRLAVLLREFRYDLDGEQVDFSRIASHVSSEITKEHGDAADPAAYTYQTTYWTELLDCAFQIEANKQAVMVMLDEEEKTVLSSLFQRLSGAEVAAAFQYQPRDYVVRQLTDLGLTLSASKSLN